VFQLDTIGVREIEKPGKSPAGAMDVLAAIGCQIKGIQVPDSNMPKQIRRFGSRLHFYLIRLPLIYALIPIGFIFEFVVTFPFMVLTRLDRDRAPKKRDSGN